MVWSEKVYRLYRCRLYFENVTSPGLRESWPRLAALVVFCAVAAAGFHGIGRSLWLDEAWTANSLREASWGGMFHYSGWLQVNPPLFLLLARGAVQAFGLSDGILRAVPFFLALAGFLSLLAAGWRVLSPGFAVLCTTLVALHPTAIEYSHTLKPYSGELAASATLLLVAILYIQNPSRARYLWLAGAVMVALPLAYPSVFLLPGIVLAIFFAEGFRKAAGLAVAASAVLLPEYWFFIRPNLSPQLHDFWAVDLDNRINAGLIVVALFCLAAGARVAVWLTAKWMKKERRAVRPLAQMVCVLPCLLLAASRLMGLYPISHRTRLFVLPCLALLAAMILEDFVPRLKTPPMQWALLALALGFAGLAITNQITQHRDLPEEDFAAAVPYLKTHVAPNDLLLVHAASKEGFLLYAAMDGWKSTALFGDTGWPCCVPGKEGRPGTSRPEAVLQDLDSKVPMGFTGRVWLFYSTRPTHWTYVGINEGDLWRKHLWERGCPPGPYVKFENLAVSPMDCVSAK
jgi:hypothetical protein